MMAPMLEPAPGHLLVASPLLEDPNFRRTVVFIGDHGPDGTFGLVLNRPLGIDPSDEVPEWSSLLTTPLTLFSGGPVSPDTMIGVGLGSVAERAAPDPITLVNLTVSPAADLERVRLFAGHAGWGAGQLQSELDQEAWFVVHRAPGDVFTAEPELLWQSVLRRQPGELQMLSFYPRDISSN